LNLSYEEAKVTLYSILAVIE